MNSEVSRVAELADAGERMIERLRTKAFLPESRKGLTVRYGIAEEDGPAPGDGQPPTAGL